MAEEKSKIDILIETASAAKNVGTLRKALKELSFEQENVERTSPDFDKLSDAINDVDGRIGDLTDSMRTLTGTGVERLNASTGLLNEGFNNLDTDKVKLGMKGITDQVVNLTKTFQTSGKITDRFKQGASQLGEGFKKLKETGVGELIKSVVQLGKAILTNPIMLLAAVIIGLIAVVVKFSDKIKFARNIVEGIGKVIDFVIQKLKDLADWLHLTDFAGEEAAQGQIDRNKEIVASEEKKFDRQIKLAQAAGKDTVELEKEKQKAVMKGISAQIDGLEKLEKINGKLTDEQIKNLAELKDAYANAETELNVITLTAETEAKKKAEEDKKKADEEAAKKAEEARKRAEEANKKRLDDNRNLEKQIQDQKVAAIQDDEAREKAKADLDNQRAIESINKSSADQKIKNEALAQQKIDYENSIAKIEEDFAKKKADKEAADKAAKEAADKAEIDKKVSAIQEEASLQQLQFEAEIIAAGDKEAKILEIKMQALEAEKEAKIAAATLLGENLDIINQEYANKEKELTKETEEFKKEEAKKTEAAKREALDAGLNAAQGLTNLFFAGQEAAAKGDAKKQLELKKKQFKVDKAFNLVRATISGVRSVMSALEGQPPISYVMAAINGVIAATNIAKIASSKFEGGETSGGSMPSAATPPSGGGASAPAPSFSAGSFYGIGQGPGMQDQGVAKVVVVETDITKTQKNVSKIETRATQTL